MSAGRRARWTSRAATAPERMAEPMADDREGYTAAKTAFVARVLDVSIRSR
jgi:hypothetical protein